MGGKEDYMGGKKAYYVSYSILKILVWKQIWRPIENTGTTKDLKLLP